MEFSSAVAVDGRCMATSIKASFSDQHAGGRQSATRTVVDLERRALGRRTQPHRPRRSCRQVAAAPHRAVAAIASMYGLRAQQPQGRTRRAGRRRPRWTCSNRKRDALSGAAYRCPNRITAPTAATGFVTRMAGLWHLFDLRRSRQMWALEGMVVTPGLNSRSTSCSSVSREQGAARRGAESGGSRFFSASRIFFALAPGSSFDPGGSCRGRMITTAFSLASGRRNCADLCQDPPTGTALRHNHWPGSSPRMVSESGSCLYSA